MSTLKSQVPPRRRIKLACPEISITDPDENRSFSMTSIKKRLDQGITPALTADVFYNLQPLRFSNLQDALDFQQNITQAFERLPVDLRKAMGNDIRNLESFLSDPNNKELLTQHGLIPSRDASNTEVIDAIKSLKPDTVPEEPQIPPKKVPK